MAAVLGQPSGSAGEAGRGSPSPVEARPSRVLSAAARHRLARGFGVGLWETAFTEPGRVLEPPHSPAGDVPAPRALPVQVRYPSEDAGSAATAGAEPARGAGPFPLVVFGPGYDEVPQDYAVLLDAWARAGFVVAAPTFPLTNPQSPGGPDESDVVNQPADLSFLTSMLLRESSGRGDPLTGLLVPGDVAVAGQSDGGDSALALADNSCCRDPAVRAVIVLAGAEWRGFAGSWFPPPAVPLMAVQGTADKVNPAADTGQYFARAPEPKFLLCLPGAGHLGPFTTSSGAEELVARATTDFLGRYLYDSQASLSGLKGLGSTSVGGASCSSGA